GVVAQGTLRLLEAVRDYQQATGDQARLYQSGSSEMFGAGPAPQWEPTAFDPRFLRPAEVNRLEGDARRAADALGWRPKVSFAELVAIMVDSDLDLAARELSFRDNGHAAVHVG
ncbi:MAG: GDP-mannose 4,6-dehydratase, partial [Pseudomonadota bacterium]|nr:GDP-mannose 4,6-dehydratase [Pseudomonadota bacterium]